MMVSVRKYKKRDGTEVRRHERSSSSSGVEHFTKSDYDDFSKSREAKEKLMDSYKELETEQKSLSKKIRSYDMEDPNDREMILDLPYSQLNKQGRKQKRKKQLEEKKNSITLSS